jgi:uncharacterized repeat protein (TIGR02543 family)
MPVLKNIEFTSMLRRHFPIPMNPLFNLFCPVVRTALRVDLLAIFAFGTTAFGGLVSGTSSMQDYQTGSEKLTVYTDVPGHHVSMMNGYASRAKSDIYEIWVRSAATDNVWVQCFANMTYNRGLEMPPMTDFQTPTSTHAYQKHTAGWTHTYANIEMSENSPVEVEIRKIGATTLNGSTAILKSAVHPAHKMIAGSKSDDNGRVYFKINNPCQVVIDINGQMDDHHSAYPVGSPGGAMLGKSPVHSIAFYANPIMEKPVASPTNAILTVNPADSSRTTRLTQPDPASYDTLVFAPGIHNVGPNFKLYPGKSYYIPGDAILYGNIGNTNVPATGYRSSGDRIRIFGYGTICGIQVPHYQNTWHDDTSTGNPNPEYSEWHAWTGVKDQGIGIVIDNAWDTTIQGVTTIDPANFNTGFGVFPGRSNDHSLVSWVKLHSWRVNGDGFGGYSKVEDSFFRTSDDSTYVRDWRRRCTFWKDTNANLFRFVNYKSGGLEDCDIVYCRWRDPGGVGCVFEFANGGFDVAGVEDLKLTIRNVRIHDKMLNPSCLFAMETLKTYRGITFENLSLYEPKNGRKSILKGSAVAPWFEQLVFKNVTFQNSLQDAYDAGTLLTAANFNTYFETNEFVKYTLFDHPRDLNIIATADPVRGFISKNPNTATHVETSLVTLSATPKPGYAFSNWSGLDTDDPSTNAAANPITIRMLDHRDITANFVLADIANPVVIDTPTRGTWEVPAGVYSATFEVWGGGGAGGSAHHVFATGGPTNISVRGGGGTGAGFAKTTLPVVPGQMIHYNVGAGGLGAVLVEGESFPAINSFSGDGEISSASIHGGPPIVSAIGGLGGQNRSATTSSVGGQARTAPVTGCVGDIVNYGGGGAQGNSNGTGGGGGSAGLLGSGGTAPAPASGSSPAGTAGDGGGTAGGTGHNGTNNGNIGGFPGGGGSGAGVRNSTAPFSLRSGGKGGDGKMIVTYNTMTFALTTNAENGTVTPGGSYTSGSTATIAATPNPGYDFTGWSGDLSGSINPANVLLDRNKTITARFTQKPFVLKLQPARSGGDFELSMSNLEPTWTYELQESADLVSPWVTVPGSLKTNVMSAVWTATPLSGEKRKFFRVIKRN